MSEQITSLTTSTEFTRLDIDVTRPWGSFHALGKKEDEWFVKYLKINAGERLSLQKHFKRQEMWVITKGKARVQKGTDLFEVGPKDTVFIDFEQEHRMEGITDAEFIEISFGDFDEEDEVRLEDDYGRVV